MQVGLQTETRKNRCAHALCEYPKMHKIRAVQAGQVPDTMNHSGKIKFKGRKLSEIRSLLPLTDAEMTSNSFAKYSILIIPEIID